MKTEHAKVITPQFLANYFKIELDEAEEIHKKLERIVYKNNDAIVTAGDDSDGLYFLEDGQATVFSTSGEAVNEMEAGQYFGEYAILADEKRMSTVRAHGRVVAYRMSSEDFLQVVSEHPKITGRLLKQVYAQISDKHTKLASLTARHRGVMWSPSGARDSKPAVILATYGITLAIFLLVHFMAPHMTDAPAWWQVMPLAFLMGFALWTKRILEAMLLTVMLLAGMLNDGDFLAGFEEMMIEGIGNTGTSETIIIMSMVEAFAALLAAAGVANAFKKLAENLVKKKSDSMFGMLLVMILVCLDECLNVITAGFSMNETSDRLGVPRENRALLGSFSTAICSIIPFSLWGAYISGWIGTYFDKGNIFLHTIPFNLAGWLSFLFAILLCAGLLPKTKQLKAAFKRVEEGGKLWPEGSERYFETEAPNNVVGKPINLLLPMLVWSVSSIMFGMIQNPGDYAMAPVSGLVTTLIFMFVLYVSQRLMTPKMFFEVMANGIGNALMPILLLVLAERIAVCLEQLGFDALLEVVIPVVVGGNLFLVPAIIFVLCTVICLGIGSCWGMYGLGIPISIFLATRLELNVALCLAAALAAGLTGVSLCPYLVDSDPVVTSIGCGPVSYRKIRFQYWIPLTVLCTIGYVLLGYFYC